MNRNKKIISGALSGVLAISMITPTFAANNSDSVIDTNRKGTLNIHKLIENDGNIIDNHGLAIPTSQVPIDNIGFDYVKIADIVNVAGIVISEDGAIDYDSVSGTTSAGAYFKANPKFEELMEAAGITPKAIYVLEDAANTQATLEYEFDDDKFNELLVEEQEDVDDTKAAYEAALADYQNKLRAYNAANNAASNAANNAAILEDARDDAQDALDAAEAALAAAEARADAAEDSLETATETLATATTELNNAQTALDAAIAALDADNTALAEARTALSDASHALADATAALAAATQAKAVAQSNLDKATAAQAAAQEIFDAAVAAWQGSDTGSADSIDGTINAVKFAKEQLDEANRYLEACQAAFDDASDAFDDAEAAFDDAEAAFDDAQAAFDDAQDEVDTSSAEYIDAKNAFKTAKDAFDAAQAAFNAADAENDAAIAALADAQAKKDAAQDALDAAQAALNNATSDSGSASADADAALAALEAAEAVLDDALEDYQDAVAALDAKAATNGISKYYVAEDLQEAWETVMATLTEEEINEWVASNAPSNNGALAEGYTDDHGTVTFSGMDLGLYVVAETDITYHDGTAGAWNDGLNWTYGSGNINLNGTKTSGHINNDEMNTFDLDEDKYVIQPLDGHDQGTSHEYSAGQVYRESVNPESPVVESKSAPFLVSLPTTNSIDTTVDDVAAGDNFGEAGTVWQYTIDVYPKNQTTGVYKRIIDPDEAFGNEVLRTSEDFQAGDLIDTMIWADAPKLAGENKHIDFAVADTMTDGVTFKGIEKVLILPKSQLLGDASVITVTTDPEGEDGVASGDTTPANTTKIKYYHIPDGGSADEADEITQAVFEERANVTGELAFYSDIDADGVDQGSTANVYGAKSYTNGDYTGTYFATRISSKHYEDMPATSAETAIQAKNLASTFEIDVTQDFPGEELAAADYRLIMLDDAPLTITDKDGLVTTAIPQGTHGWAVQLTESGLTKLNARGSDSVVVVFFDSELNESAKIGQTPENSNFAELFYTNSNTLFRSVASNTVYEYTYELRIKKEGVEDASKVKFIVSRVDAGDINQSADKDLTGVIAQRIPDYDDDQMVFVEEAPGIYHVALPSEIDSVPTESVNGVEYNVVSPAPDGTLVIKGLDSDDYRFQEIATEEGNNLLKSAFIVSIRANDDAVDSLRDGRISAATVKFEGADESTDLTIGAQGIDGLDSMDNDIDNLGIASMIVNNYDIVDLRTGGTGRLMFYIGGAALAAGLAVGIFVSKKKERSEEE